ncbi:phage terminase large subunit [Nitratiruptor phage NrS-5]|uniref:terminase gpA endonuclease subunit n=1 Tax=unclassified Nitratiruptor TaxID=2624044 RepID=UPI001916C8D4|nr:MULTISPECIES: terminase gpA endonuclease subunit [unclassified Nitratiruptor]BCD61737.1 phage terminase large subunit [Nitratiruptor sp. YY08-13]BCD65672.1 phage terminase large subunit [Nitratiruptor sp. YY08-26]BCD83215.1 phage terminase large subunit [Nitratiruptor phage NrS-4]BCD83274.1 phage terminase large subunit [Nitratiruptor phage NrS-5]
MPKLIIGQRTLNALYYKAKIPMDEWAEEFYTLESKSAIGGGKFSFEYAPHLKKPLEIFSRDVVKNMTLWFGSQGGKTTVTFIFVNWIIDRAPNDIGFYLPNDNLVKSTADDRIRPSIERTVNKDSLILRKEEKKAKDNMTRIPFLGGTLYVLGAASTTNRKSRPFKYIIMDEIADFKHEWVEEIEERAKTFEQFGAKILKTSTSNHANDAIATAYKLSDAKYEYFVKCPYCKEEHIDDFIQNIVYPKPDEIIYTSNDEEHRLAEYLSKASKDARYQCPHCKKLWNNDDKNKAIDNGGFKLVSGVENASRVGFRVSSFISKLVTIEQMAFRYLKVKDNEELLKKFYSGWLAKNYIPKEKGTSKDKIWELKCDLGEFELPKDTVALYMGVDVQKDWYAYVIMAFDKDLNGYIIGYGRAEDEYTIEQLIRHEYNGIFLDAVGIDDGYQTTEVHEFCYLQNMELGENFVCATRGSARPLSKLFVVTTVDVDMDGRRLAGGVKRYTINTTQIKDDLQAMIDRGLNNEPKRLYIHKDMDDVIADSLTSEYKPEGENKWIPKTSHPNNHWWDAANICLFLARRDKINLLKTQSRSDGRIKSTPTKRRNQADWLDRY